MMRFSLPLAATALLLAAGCDPAPSLTQTDIPGARLLALRCSVPSTGEDPAVGAPLDGCGCVERIDSPDGQVRFRRMGRVECDCEAFTADGALIARDAVRVRADCSGGECVEVRGDDGDFIVDDGTGPAMACTPRRAGEVMGYVGTNGRGEVAIVDLIAEPGDGSSKQIVDVDRTVPGTTAIFIGDLISDLETHPNGDYVFTVNSSSGTVSIIASDTALTPSHTVDLGAGPLMDAAVWPPIGRPHPTGAIPLGFVSAPRAGQILELDLDALGAAGAEAGGVIRATFELPDGAHPGRITVHPDGTALIVAHARTAKVTIFDLAGDAAPRTVDLAPRHPCSDGYLVRVLEPDEDTTCADGFDNDGDGTIDGADEDCLGAARSEALDPRCPKQSECLDGLDNDEDGLVDADDPDCQPCSGADCPASAIWLDWERPTIPACVDGLDNDEDGRVDRADPGCTSESDEDEADAVELKGTPACANGLDDDADGLIDDLDPGCTDDEASVRYRFEAIPQCADRVDNDGDGRVDFGADPDCWAASDASEGVDALTTGPIGLLSLRAELTAISRVFTYVIDGAGNLLWIDMDDPALPVERINLGRVSPLVMAARQLGLDSALLLIGSDTALRSIEISAPTPLRTEDGRPIFARLDAERTAADDGTRIFLSAFYVVEDGVAYAVPGLDEHLTPPDAEDGDQSRSYPAQSPVHLAITDPVVPYRLPDAPADRTPLALVDPTGRYAQFDRGRLDPLVFAAPEVRTLLNAEANVALTAQGRTNRLVGAPRFAFGTSPAQFDPDRHPTFCQLAQPDPDVDGGLTAPQGCVPVGFTAQGQPESVGDALDRTRFRTDIYEGIRVIEDRVEALPPGTWSLGYQAELPDSESRTGQFAGRASDEQWTMVDYNTDFCRIGVEVGDVVLVDAFVPKALAPGTTLAAECVALEPENRPGDPLVQREPLRYLVTEVGAYVLGLARDTESDASRQVGRDDRAVSLGYYDPPPAPLAECAGQFIVYRIRAGRDAWLLDGPAGHRHPWINREGRCEESPSRVQSKRFGRARLGEPFENEWFRFTLGAWQPIECLGPAGCAEGLSCLDYRCVEAPCSEGDAGACPDGATCSAGRCTQGDLPPVQARGLPTGSLPHMLDAHFDFDVQTGLANRRLSDFTVLPGSLQWLPNDDRAYAVDAAFETVVEAAGLNVYRELMTFVRRFR